MDSAIMCALLGDVAGMAWHDFWHQDGRLADCIVRLEPRPGLGDAENNVLVGRRALTVIAGLPISMVPAGGSQ
jgi:hypothetical protein